MTEAERERVLEDAIAFAAVSHRGQVDKGGEPYILHPLRIMAKMNDPLERIAAVLHDVVEDSDVMLEEIHALFGGQVADAVDALTRRSGESYVEFIERVCDNEIACKVKLVDIEDNLDLSRLGRAPAPADHRRVEKYAAAREQILAAIGGEHAEATDGKG